MHIGTVALALALLNSAHGQLMLRGFGELNPGDTSQIVVFYDEGAPASSEVVRTLDQVAQRLGSEGVNWLKWNKVDFGANAQQMQAQGIDRTALPWVFISIDVFERYQGPTTFDILYRYISAQLVPVRTFDVFGFNTEAVLLSQQRPQFVKFYEEWCSVCKSIANNFLRSATEWKGRVDFVEVDCKKPNGQAFCNKHKLTGYPSFKLYLPGNSIPIDYDGLRNPMAWAEFLQQRTAARQEL